jgi:Icc-related predicted phosphoesterase
VWYFFCFESPCWSELNFKNYVLTKAYRFTEQKWNDIPAATDILITHGPAWGFLDDVEGRRGQHLGCELLAKRINTIRPKIHVCGHIHSGHGHYFDGHTHYFNAAVLNERYEYGNLPWSFDWEPITNEIKWL